MAREKAQKPAAKNRGGASSVKSIVGRCVLAACAVLVCAIPPLFVNDVIGYLPLLALVMIVVISFVYLQILKRTFSYSEDSLASTCERGSDVDFVLKFKNASFLVLLRLEAYIYVSNLFDETDEVYPVSLSLMPRENKDVSFQARFNHIGPHAAGVQRIVLSDLLGLFSHTIVNEKRHHVEVMPRLFEANDVPLSSEASNDSQKPRQAFTVDDMDYAGVREYTWGDPIKTIHWKLSARNPNGEYLTRLFETFNNPGLVIVMDTTAPAYDSESLMYVFDGIVESALSVNQFAASHGIDPVMAFKSKYGDNQKLRLANPRDARELVRVLPRIGQDDGQAAVDLLRREANTLHGEDNVVLCTSRVEEELMTLLISLRVRKRNPVLFVVVPPALDSHQVADFARPLRRLDEAQVPYFVVNAASDFGVEQKGH